jgi:valyl-tRNA synthetase
MTNNTNSGDHGLEHNQSPATQNTNTSTKAQYKEPNIPAPLLSPYDPAKTEPAIISIHEKSDFANPDTCIKYGLTTTDSPSFTIVLPPPNVTGTLHLGHGLMATLQDISIRFERMRGKQALWIPGTDHAAIATQSKVEKDISKKEGKSRYDLGRDELLKRIDAFATESHDTIVSQIKRMGASLDWSREAFTLDEARNKAVRTMFKKMYDDGLIYQGSRIVNWDPKGQTTISDDEIVYEDRKSKLYTFKYSKDFPISISTTRPETKVGDTAVAVHPEDERYTEYVGKTYDLDFCGSKISVKIIADHAVEKDFGTGALGVTPAHSVIDWEMSRRHDLPVVQVIDEKARMMVSPDSPLYDKEKNIGMKTTDAREKVVEWLREQGLLEGEEEVAQRVGTAERTGGIIEPLPKKQWWVAVTKPFTIKHSKINGISSGQQTTLKEIMQKAVSGGQVSIMPEHYHKTYFHWIDNLNDWCISRQIWYGHRIPAYIDLLDSRNQSCHLAYQNNIEIFEIVNKYIHRKLSEGENIAAILSDLETATFDDGKGNGIIPFYLLKRLFEENLISLEKIKNYASWKINDSCYLEVIDDPKAIKDTYLQEPDTLDTWFSSGLWTFSTLGWPENYNDKTDPTHPQATAGSDLSRFHPTDLLVTGPDIIFFWVARMILMTGYALGDIPFSKVYMNGIVRDVKGQKMSKSLGNGGDPIEISDKYGADALRMFYAMSTAPGTDSRLDENKIKGFKHFANKLWNITRFILTATEGYTYDKGFTDWSETDAVLRKERDDMFVNVTKEISENKYHLASEKIYHYAWSTLADVILEDSKVVFASDTSENDPAASDKKTSRAQFLLETIRRVVIVTHPFMPHVTEELWSLLNTGKSLIERSGPNQNHATINPTDLLMAQRWPYLNK